MLSFSGGLNIFARSFLGMSIISSAIDFSPVETVRRSGVAIATLHPVSWTTLTTSVRSSSPDISTIVSQTLRAANRAMSSAISVSGKFSEPTDDSAGVKIHSGNVLL